MTMTVFTYSATDRTGKVSKGERDAENEKVLASALKQEGLLLLDARKREPLQAIRFNINVGEIMGALTPVPLSEKMFFARNLAVMIAAGLSLNRALETLSGETTNAKLKSVIVDINAAVSRGLTLADALRAHEKIFGELFVSMVEVGETTGKLTLVLKLVANQMKRDATLRKRIRGALMYPLIIVLALGGIGTLMMTYVLPTLSATIKELGVALPLSTRILIGTSDFIMRYGIWIAAVGVIVAALAWRARTIPPVARVLARYSLHLPIFGSLIRKYNTARFCRTLSYLETSGVPIVRSLQIVSHTVSNLRFREVLVEASEEVKKGVQLHTLLAKHPDVFQPLVTEMLAVGEETGKVAEMLLRLALFFEEEVADVTKNLSTIVEPVLMIAIGVIVGIFAISILQPIYSSLSTIGI